MIERKFRSRKYDQQLSFSRGLNLRDFRTRIEDRRTAGELAKFEDLTRRGPISIDRMFPLPEEPLAVEQELNVDQQTTYPVIEIVHLVFKK